MIAGLQSVDRGVIALDGQDVTDLPPQIQRRYHAWAGCDVLAITDHDRYTIEPEGEDELFVIGGTELSLTAPKSGGPL